MGVKRASDLLSASAPRLRFSVVATVDGPPPADGTIDSGGVTIYKNLDTLHYTAYKCDSTHTQHALSNSRNRICNRAQGRHAA